MKSKEQFCIDAKKVHGDKYDYSLVEYKGNKEKVKIICPTHGVFEQSPNAHLRTGGCNQCGYIIGGSKCRISQEEFIERSTKVHSGKYDYSKVEYANNNTKVCIICPVHGEFWQLAGEHSRGKGCNACGGTMKLDVDTFMEKAVLIHGNKYDYSRVEYKGNKIKVTIGCPTHGWYGTTPNMHLRGENCPHCANINKRKNRFNLKGYVQTFQTNSTETEYYIYRRWVSLVGRCYDKKVHEKQPTYTNCEVCIEWRNFDNFKSWMLETYREGFFLDKDVLVKNNKIYSPQTCCWIPNEINILFSRKSKIRTLPIGVSLNPAKNKYVARINTLERQIFLGTFSTPEEAFLAYKQAKEAYIKEVANKWKDRIAPNVYDALMKYEVEITD